jgi:hypothetical protein
MIQPTALADWSTPRPVTLPEQGPGVDGDLRAQLEAALHTIAADPSVKALVLFGSRATGTARARHVISCGMKGHRSRIC